MESSPVTEHLVISITSNGENIFKEPLVSVAGVYVVDGKVNRIEYNGPVASLEDLFKWVGGVFRTEIRSKK